MVKPVRCRYFDHDGKTIGGGCLNAHCHFAHPSDKEWSTLPRTQQFILDDVIAGRSFKKSSRRRTPPPRSRSFYSPPPRSSSSRSHSRGYSFSRKSRSPTPRRSRSPTRYRSPPSRSDRRRASDKSRRSVSPVPGPSRDSRELSLAQDPRERPTPPDPNVKLSPKVSSEPSVKSTPAGPNVTLIHARRASSSERMPPPPPPSIQPPPLPPTSEATQIVCDPVVARPVPSPPVQLENFLANKATVTLDPKWREKIKELTSAVTIQSKRRGFEENLQILYRLRDHSNLDETQKTLVHKAIEDAQARDKQHAIESLEAESKLKVFNAFPESPDVVKHRLDILEHVTGLQKTAMSILSAIKGKQDRSAAEPDKMDIDPSSPSRSPAPATVDLEPKVNPEFIEAIQQDIDDMDEKVADIQEQIMRLEDSQEQEAASAASKVFDEYLEERENMGTTALSTCFQELQVRVHQQNDQIQTLYGSMLENVDTQSSITKLKAELERSRDQIKGAISGLNDRVSALESKHQSNDDRISVLEAAFEAYMENPMITSSVPPAYLISALQEPIEQVIQQSIHEGFEELRVNTQNLVRAETEKLYQHVWKKTELMRNVSTLLAKKLQGGQQNVQPVQPLVNGVTHVPHG